MIPFQIEMLTKQCIAVDCLNIMTSSFEATLLISKGVKQTEWKYRCSLILTFCFEPGKCLQMLSRLILRQLGKNGQLENFTFTCIPDMANEQHIDYPCQ